MRIPLVVLCLVCAGCHGRPKDPTGWAQAAIRASHTPEKLEAIREARRAPGDRQAAVSHLIVLLQESPRVRAEAATVLGEFGDLAAAPALLAALDLSAGKDLPADVRESNRRVVTALGALRARTAVPALLQLLRSRDGFTQIAAVDALGEIGDPAAVEALLSLAAGDEVEPFITRKALLALGKIGEPRAGPGVLRMLFQERAGVSFFPEAAFAVYQIGSPMAAPLVAMLKGEDRDLAEWAKNHRVLPGVLRAKAAELLGDVEDERAVPALLESLAYQDADPQVQVLVRACAAESLGRRQARGAVQPIGRLLLEGRDADARERYAEALARIGDPAGLPALRTAAAQGSWEERGAILAALSRLGTPEDRGLLARVSAELPAHAAEVRRMLDRITVAGECQADLACWTGKLSDARGWVRDRAALEVGRAGGLANAEALAIAAALPADSDDEVAARGHAILALEWVTNHGTLGGYAVAERLEALVDREKGRGLTALVNQEAQRLAVRLRRQAVGGAR